MLHFQGRIRIPVEIDTGLTPAQEAALNERQKKMIEQAVAEGSISTAWCFENLGVVKDTVRRDFDYLVEKEIFTKVGKGRATHYIVDGLVTEEGK